MIRLLLEISVAAVGGTMGKAAHLGLAPRDHQALRHQHVMKALGLDLLLVDRATFERHNAKIDMAKTML